MQQYNREFFISRIVSKYLIFKDLRITYPTLEVLYESQRRYMDAVHEAEEEGILSNEEILEQMVLRGLWTEYEENQLEDVLPKHLEYWKVELFKNYEDEDSRTKITSFLETSRNEINRLFKKKHAYDYMTIHGAGTFSKWYYIVENSTFQGTKKTTWKKHKVINALDCVNRNVISDEIIRELARNEPWRSIWLSAQVSRGLFPYSACEFSEDQKRLIAWSKLYDNIREYPDCPPEHIIDDDDALDGWLILKRREREVGKNVDKYKINRHRPDAEVFIVAKNAKAVKEIYDLNSEVNRNVIKQRIDVIEKKGEVKDLDFADVRQKQQMALTQAYMSARRGRG